MGKSGSLLHEKKILFVKIGVLYTLKYGNFQFSNSAVTILEKSKD